MLCSIPAKYEYIAITLSQQGIFVTALSKRNGYCTLTVLKYGLSFKFCIKHTNKVCPSKKNSKTVIYY